MDDVARLMRGDRADLFQATAQQMQLHPINVEKDFWVCWLLKELFTIPQFKGRLVFKGGTSLSKCFGLIQRFSEDIDMAVDFEHLGFRNERDPRQESLSNSKRQRLLVEMLLACQDYIAGEFVPALTQRIASHLGPTGWVLGISPHDPNTVEFVYPSAFDMKLDYILGEGNHTPCRILPSFGKGPAASLLTPLRRHEYHGHDHR